MKIKSLFLTGLIWWSSSVYSADTVLPVAAPTSAIETAKVSFFETAAFQAKLNQLGYKTEPDPVFGSPTLFKKIKDDWVSFGEISEMDLKYTFHWESEKAHAAHLKNGKITSEEMTNALNEPGQALGKGFYVSTHPVDSRDYGDYLTVFESVRPLIVVNGADSTATSFANDLTIVNELKQLGFDAMGAGHYPNWITIINADYLNQTKDIDQPIFEYILAHFSDDYNSARAKIEENFKVIFKEKNLAFKNSAFAQTVIAKRKACQSLNEIEKQMAALLFGKAKNSCVGEILTP